MGIPIFTLCLVHRELSTLDTSKSSGPDQLHPKLRKWLATFLAGPLADLFNNSFATAVVPGDWEAAVICPIFKKGGPEDVANDRPVSLTSVVCKVLERNLKRAILWFLIQCQALTGCQHDFLPHQPCLSNLLVLEETISRLMDDGNTADMVYLDFAQAFASVNHRFLLAKLESVGLFDKVVRWIRSYLTGRTYREQVADALSQETRIKSRVPQESVIRSLLLLLFVNDLSSVITVTTLLFADDVKMVSPHSQSDLLQSSPLQCLELVGKLGPPFQSLQIQPQRYWTGSST